MSRARFPLAFAALSAALGGCVGGGGATFEQLRARATFDLQCPVPSTQFFEIDDRTRGVRGCGKQMTYVEVCDNRPDGWHCTWVLNAPAWFVAPEHVPARPGGTWWWTEPQGAPVPAAPSAPPAPGPSPASTAPVAPPTLPPVIPPPPAVPVQPLPPLPVPTTPKAEPQACGVSSSPNACTNPPAKWPPLDRGF